jgi:hypothetical protein
VWPTHPPHRHDPRPIFGPHAAAAVSECPEEPCCRASAARLRTARYGKKAIQEGLLQLDQDGFAAGHRARKSTPPDQLAMHGGPHMHGQDLGLRTPGSVRLGQTAVYSADPGAAHRAEGMVCVDGGELPDRHRSPTARQSTPVQTSLAPESPARYE